MYVANSCVSATSGDDADATGTIADATNAAVAAVATNFYRISFDMS